MARSEAFVRQEPRQPGSWVTFTLAPEGLLKQTFSLGVRTHSDLLYYDEIWDVFRDRTPRLGRMALLALLTAASAAVLLAPGVPVAFLVPVWLLLAAGWVVEAVRLRALSVRVYGFEGHELAVLQGPRNERFDAFLEEMARRVAAKRFPLQAVLDGIQLGGCSWKGRLVEWRSTLLYDRLVIERRWPFGFEQREFHALTALRDPVGLRWRLPVPALVMLVPGLLFAPSAAVQAWMTGGAAMARLAAGLGLCALFGAAWLAAGAGASATLSRTDGTLESPAIPWWQSGSRREVLEWFARVVKLADRVDLLHEEDYWEYHRTKLSILREEGFLDDWPYRSALSRLNTQEREDLGE